MATGLASRAVRRSFNTAALRKQRAFKPFVQPTTAPAGSFDPTIGAQGRASDRGLGDLQQDTGIQNIRSSDDLNTLLGQAAQNRDTSLSNLLRQGIATDQDFATTTGTRQRNYSNLAGSQTNRANAAGLVGVSGYDAQAAANRNANQTREQDQANLEHQRYSADYAAQQQGIGQNYDRTTGAANLQYQRGLEDRGNTLSRAVRENTAFHGDINEAELYSAKNAGLLPTPPPGEVTRVGLTYNQLPGRQGAVLQSGRAISQSALINMLRKRGWKPR